MNSKHVTAMVLLMMICLAGGWGYAAQEGSDVSNPYLGKVRHVVLYSYKDGVTQEQQDEIAAKSRNLINQIDLIRDLEWGPNLGTSPVSQGYTHCLIMTFDSFDDVKTYAAHPAHQEFLALARPHLEQLLVVDYVAQE